MRKPNMTPEVLEAIHLMFEDYPDIEADCYLYLSALNTLRRWQVPSQVS